MEECKLSQYQIKQLEKANYVLFLHSYDLLVAIYIDVNLRARASTISLTYDCFIHYARAQLEQNNIKIIEID